MKLMNQPLLAGRVAIITGASRGIGAATAKAFVAAGAALAHELLADGGRAIAVPTDVGDPASVQNLVAQTVRAFGRLDVAFNNAAGGGQGPTLLADLPVEAFDAAIAVSLRGVFLSMKYEIAARLAAGGGAIGVVQRRPGGRGRAGWVCLGQAWRHRPHPLGGAGLRRSQGARERRCTRTDPHGTPRGRGRRRPAAGRSRCR